MSRRPKPDFDAEHGLLRVFNLDSSQSVQVFRFCHPLPIMLYHSPPVLHPTKTLVVWPLCGGEVLFGDIEGKTYFMRKARPSTRKSMVSFLVIRALSLTLMFSTPHFNEMSLFSLREIFAYRFFGSTTAATYQS